MERKSKMCYVYEKPRVDRLMNNSSNNGKKHFIISLVIPTTGNENDKLSAGFRWVVEGKTLM